MGEIEIGWGKDVPESHVEWLWKPLIPYGSVTVIQGDGGDGKSSLILTIAAMLTTGIRPPEIVNGKLLPCENIQPEVVFYASTENDVKDIAMPVFRRNGGDDNLFAFSKEASSHLVLTKENIINIITRTGAKLLIIDPLQAFLATKVNMNKVTDMRKVFTDISHAALETGAAIVLLGHLNKNESAKDVHRGLGSVDIAAAARSIILVEANRNDLKAPRKISCIKSNFDESDYSTIMFMLDEERKIHLIEASKTEATIKEPGREEAAKRLIKEILKDGPILANDAKERLKAAGVSKRTMERAKGSLHVRSEKNGDNKWVWVL